jgi:hypothetical protein
MNGHMRLFTLHLTQEQSETRNREPDAHQAQAGPYPRKKGSFGSEVDSRISFCFFGVRHVVFVLSQTSKLTEYMDMLPRRILVRLLE